MDSQNDGGQMSGRASEKSQEKTDEGTADSDLRYLQLDLDTTVDKSIK